MTQLSAELYELSTLKFRIENEYHYMEKSGAKLPDDYIVPDSTDLEISAILKLYKENLQTTGNEFLQTHKDILTKINDILMKRCEHNWINDVVETPFSERNICYCNNCFMYK